jgi:hypothetical protein
MPPSTGSVRDKSHLIRDECCFAPLDTISKSKEKAPDSTHILAILQAALAEMPLSTGQHDWCDFVVQYLDHDGLMIASRLIHSWIVVLKRRLVFKKV